MIKKLTGVDVDIETSLKEYGIAWEEREEENEIRFYYSVKVEDVDGQADHTRFDWSDVSKDVDVKKEYDWAEFEKVASLIGVADFFKEDLLTQIQSLLSYYGYQNLFGESYSEGLTYEEVLTTRNFDEILKHYFVCALWSSNETLDGNYSIDDLDESVVTESKEDIINFLEEAEELLTEEWTDEQVGHDFWLTRNRHGAGFWDRGLKNGDKLTKLCEPFGEVNIYVEDNKIHIQ